MTQLNKILSVKPETLNAINMSFHKGQPWFEMQAGKEHYRLLAYISSLFPDSTLLDVGTYLGDSAAALAKTAKVVSFDVTERNLDDGGNVRYITGDVLSEVDLILKAPFILLDTYHNGDFEAEFCDSLDILKYKGLVMFDDIKLNEPMRKFWNDLQKPKHDISHVGHHSGTGLAVW